MKSVHRWYEITYTMRVCERKVYQYRKSTCLTGFNDKLFTLFFSFSWFRFNDIFCLFDCLKRYTYLRICSLFCYFQSLTCDFTWGFFLPFLMLNAVPKITIISLQFHRKKKVLFWVKSKSNDKFTNSFG